MKISGKMEMRKKRWMRQSLDGIIDLIEHPVKHQKDEVIEILGETIKKYEGGGYKIPKKYKNKYNELKGK